MTTVTARLLELHASGGLITTGWPNSGAMSISLEVAQVAMAKIHFCGKSDNERRSLVASITKALKRATKKLKKGTISQREMDGLAADVTLWLAHEFAYGDPQRYVIGNGLPSDVMAELKSKLN